MRRLAWLIGVFAVTGVAAEQPAPSTTLAGLLQRAGERVEHYLARAQRIVCLELVRLQPLSASWSSEGFGRTIESELHLSWAPAAGGTPAIDSQAVRQVLRVNGHTPRADDRNNCTTPEQESKEPQPLSLLLASKRAEYVFTMAGHARVDRRAAVMVDYRLVANPTVETKMVEGRDDCVSFNVEGGKRGRIWIDAVTHDVLRLDQSLTGMVEIPLPKAVTRRANAPASWTLERMDTSIRFKTVSFTDPEETLVLPASMSSIQITRGAGTPRLRTMTDYLKYQRFLTAGRVVGE